MPILLLSTNVDPTPSMLARLAQLGGEALSTDEARVMIMCSRCDIVLSHDDQAAALIELRSASLLSVDQSRVFVENVTRELTAHGISESRVYVQIRTFPEQTLWCTLGGHSLHAGEGHRRRVGAPSQSFESFPPEPTP